MLGRRLPLFLLFMVIAVVARADEVASRVIVLANRDDPESVKLAEYYAQKRDVPPENIIALPMPDTEIISWREYIDGILNPLRAELVKRGSLDAIGMDLFDAVGRKKYAISGHTISYLVVCRGVPLKIANDGSLPVENSPALINPAFKTNASSVDGELALLAVVNSPLIAFLPNPLFKNDKPSSIQLDQIVKVGRLDGPTYADARGLIDHAIAAENGGLIGRGYVDIGGPHALGDRWLEDVAKQLDELNFDTDVERVGGSMPAWTRMDAPALYFGWYAGELNGPFAQPGFTFPPGAVALHIHSYSAATLRSTTSGWVGPLVARGVTATFGNVNEPYLEFTHQPQLVLKSLARGDRLGDAAAYSVPVYSWQAIMVGDPLYRPFAVKPDELWARRDKLPSNQRPYVVLSRMRELDRGGDRNGAIWAGLISEKTNPSMAVALATAKLQQATGDSSGALQTLAWVASRRSFTLLESPLAVLVAQQLRESGEAKTALGVWQRVLGSRAIARELRIQWLPQALEVAREAQDARQIVNWDSEYKELTAPPPVSDEDKKQGGP
ncbi:TIGR03790 family protein [Rariglobus hedericola]